MEKLKLLLPIGHLIVLVIFSVAVMLLWNWLMPPLFGLMTISFWQALGIIVLCRILFGSFNFGNHAAHRRHSDGMFGIRRKWQNMTLEQRKEFINKRREDFIKNDFFGRFDFERSATDKNSQKEDE